MALLELVESLRENFTTQRTRIENIERVSAGYAIPEVQEINFNSELRELTNVTTKNEEIVQQLIQKIKECAEVNQEERRTHEENEEDHIRRVARLEREIFGQDGVINDLRNRQVATERRLQITEDELSDVRASLRQTQNDVAELREIITALQGGN